MPKHLYSKTEQACMDVPQMEENKMAKYRKLSRTSDQRKALLRNQVTNLLYHGKIVTTEAKAKEIRKIAESLIAMAVREKDNFETVTVTVSKLSFSRTAIAISPSAILRISLAFASVVTIYPL